MEQQKSNLAKLLATENISFQHQPSAKTAYFDIKNRILVLPVWQNISNDLYDMLVVHEVGHALDTPEKGWMKGIEDIAKKAFGKVDDKYKLDRIKGAIKGFMNVIEDARIDKRQKRRYPGARRNYVVGYRELIDRDFFGTSTRDVNSMSFIDRANMYFKGGVLLGVKFNDNEEHAFIRRMENSETFEDVIKLTEDIFLWSKKRAEEQQINIEDLVMTEDEGDGDGEDGDDEGNGRYGRRGRFGDKEGNGSQSNSDNMGHSGGFLYDFIPEPETERAWNQNQNQIVTADNGVQYIYADIPTADYNKIVDDYKVVIAEHEKGLHKKLNHESDYRRMDKAWYETSLEALNTFKKEEVATISFMVKEFEMRKQADVYSRTSIAKTGVIDTNKLHGYKHNEDLFRRITTVAEGKNHGFVMFVDWSGSMTTCLDRTMKQLFGLTMFCKRMQIPFEVYLFREARGNETYKDQFSKENGQLGPGTVKLRNILSSRMNTTELNTMYKHLWINGHGHLYECDGMGGTPLNEVIIAAEEVIKRFRKKTKVQIVNTIFLTDGEANGLYKIHGSHGAGRALGGNDRSSQVIVRDNVSKKEYKVKSHYDNTNILLRILKDRTDCNLIGFFLHKGGLQYLARRYENTTLDSNCWRENNFVAMNSDGYDEYYIINVNGMNIQKEEFKADSSMTKRKLATAFSNFSKKKAVNRILLQRFVERISKQKKVA